MDDGTSLFPVDCDKDTLLLLLNSMHPSIKYTVEEPQTKEEEGKKVQSLVFLSILINLDDSGKLWTNIHYKETNAFDYLSWDSHHPKHIMENIPYCLAKRIVVMTTKEDDVVENLNHLRGALKKRGYPEKTIDTGFHNAMLQGPAPPKKNTHIIPLISTYTSNFSNSMVIEVTKQLIKNTKDERIANAFRDSQIIESFRQPPKLLNLISNSNFIHPSSPMFTQEIQHGLKKCSSTRCKLCKLYIQEGDSFQTSNGMTWHVRCHASCNSKNVVYFLKCSFCCGKTTYTLERRITSELGPTTTFLRYEPTGGLISTST